MHGLPGDKEGVVVRRQGANTVVGGNANLVATYPSAQLKQSTWSDTVKPGDVVEFLSANVWHPAIVRGVQAPTGSVAQAAYAHSRKVLVVEPAFLGFTLSFPLRSLRLRRFSKTNAHVRGLLDSGFAFDETSNRNARPWPAYHPNGCLYTRDSAPMYMALSDYESYTEDIGHEPGRPIDAGWWRLRVACPTTFAWLRWTTRVSPTPFLCTAEICSRRRRRG